MSKKELIFLVLCMILVITFAFVVLVVYFTALQPQTIASTSANLSSTSTNLSSTYTNSSSTYTNLSSTYTNSSSTYTNCSTVSGPNPNAQCIFPFKYGGITYHQCTTAGNAAGDFTTWCSTLVDESGVHIGGAGNWGNCGPDCHFDLNCNLC